MEETRPLPETRYEHLYRAKARALEYVEAGELGNALASIGSDLGKWTEPLYPSEVLNERMTEGLGLVTANDAPGMKRWIEGFR